MNAAAEIVLTRELLQLNTVNPPGSERECARRIGALLEGWGYAVDYHEFADQRTGVIARLGSSQAKAPLCLTGHVDTVPLGTAAWSRDPFFGETEGDRLYGRGSSDMKSGVAGILVAARQVAKHLRPTPGVVLVLTAAEEGGCVGSRHLVQAEGLLGKAGAIVVGEPTANYPHVGHKGSMKLWARFRGVGAHGSMPHLGVNAIYRAARAAAMLEAFEYDTPAPPVMGRPTLNVGTFHAGDTDFEPPGLFRRGGAACAFLSEGRPRRTATSAFAGRRKAGLRQALPHPLFDMDQSNWRVGTRRSGRAKAIMPA